MREFPNPVCRAGSGVSFLGFTTSSSAPLNGARREIVQVPQRLDEPASPSGKKIVMRCYDCMTEGRTEEAVGVCTSSLTKRVGVSFRRV